MKDKISISIPGKMEYVQAVKMMVGTLASKSKFDMEQVEDIKIAVEEGIKNVDCHGNDKLSSKCDITVEILDDRMVITVEDMCHEHSIDKGIKPCIDCPNEGELAKFIIGSIMDDVEITQEKGRGRKIRMVKKYAE